MAPIIDDEQHMDAFNMDNDFEVCTHLASLVVRAEKATI